MGALSLENPALFEERQEGVLEDTIMQWYPAESRPKWVTYKAYQRRELRPWAERGRELGGVKRNSRNMDLQDKITRQILLPPAGSRVGSGAFPNGFDFSAGRTMDDFFTPHSSFDMAKTNPAR